jgi:ubiquinone/menaquinone biosynthesis C-methylase UbiE
MNSIKKLIRHLIIILKSSRFFKSVLSQPVKTYQIFSRFTDSNNNTYDLLKGYRDDMQPGWRNALNPLDSLEIPNLNDVKKRINKAQLIIDQSVELLNNFNFNIRGKKVLEIGCNDGSKTCALAKLDPSEIYGSDISYFYLLDRKEDELSLQSTRENEFLQKLRKLVQDNSLNKNSRCNPKYVEDNICDSNFESNSFDLIFSWNVLEHIQSPEKAIKEMFRILKPGGIAYNKYNPFFCQGGGHSLCTLDFPWGHLRLDHSNFKQYIKEIRPDEMEAAINFYEYSLNRMTIKDLRLYNIDSGFEILAIIPYMKNINKVTEQILTQSKSNYPNVEFNDLVSNGVTCIARKK